MKAKYGTKVIHVKTDEYLIYIAPHPTDPDSHIVMKDEKNAGPFRLYTDDIMDPLEEELRKFKQWWYSKYQVSLSDEEFVEATMVSRCFESWLGAKEIKQ